MTNRALTIAEIRFCDAICAGKSADEAHFEAYGSSKLITGWSNAARKILEPRIQQRIMELRMKMEESMRIDRERIIEEMADVAFANVADYLDHDGESITIKPMRDLTRRQARAIKNVTAEKGRISLEFHDKIAAIRQLCAALGIGQGDITLNQTFVVRAPEVVKDSKTFERLAQEFTDCDVQPPNQQLKAEKK